MRTLGILLLGSILLFSCGDVQKELPEKNTTPTLFAQADSRAPGILPKDLDVNDILFYPNKHTWRDLDEYYREKLPNHLGQDYYENLRKVVLVTLVEPFEMDQFADKATLEFYLAEMMQVDYLPDPVAFIRVAKALHAKGWEGKRLSSLAKERMDKDLRFLSTLKHPERALERYEPKQEQLKTFAMEMAGN